MEKAANDSALADARADVAGQEVSPGALTWMKIELCQQVLNAAARNFWSAENVAAALPGFLLELYSMVRCSVPLMQRAYERASAMAVTDGLAAITAEYLREHIEEELHHDEWLLEDLVAAGMDEDAVASRWPTAAVASVVGAQYCWIEHAHPAAIFGYLSVIEGNPPLPEHLDEIQLQTGFPKESFRCLRLHAAEDIAHLTQLRSTVCGLPLTAGQAKLIATSAFATVEGLIRVFEELSKADGG